MKPMMPIEENSALDGIVDFGAGVVEAEHEGQPGLYRKTGDDPIEVSIDSEPYPAPLRPNKGPA